MIRSLLAVILLLCAGAARAQDTARTWRFGAYIFRSYDTAVTILRDNNVLYHSANDPVTYTFVDTLSLNRDNKPDFVYMYQEEYAVVGMLVSQPNGGYRDIFVTDIFEFDPSRYKVAMPLPAPILPIVLRDIDNDGKRDMIVGGLDKKTGYTIPRYTQTINYTRLRSIARGMVKPKIKKAGRGKRG